jgi:hypothetical protein
VGATFFLLPFMEQMARYDTIVEDSRNAPPREWPFQSRPAYQGTIPILLCPTDPNATRPSPHLDMARTSIVLSHGDGMWHNARPDWGESEGSRVGTRGMFAPLTQHGMGHCSDGTSNTIGARAC